MDHWPGNDGEFCCILGKEVFPVCVVGSLARNGSFWIAKIGEPEMEKQRQMQATIRCGSKSNYAPGLHLYCIQ